MAATPITQSSDPDLWQTLFDAWNIQGRPRNVTYGTEIYLPVQGADNSIFFLLVNAKDYYDSRSLIGSKPATYNNIDG